MPAFQQLPQFQAPTGINFDPLNQGVRSLGNALAQRQTVENNRNITNALSRKDYAGAQAMSDDPNQALQIGQYQQRERSADLEHQRAAAQHLAGIAQMIQQAPPEQRAPMMGKLYAAQPDIAQHLTNYGVDPNDHDTASKFIIAEARGYVNPNEAALDRAKLDLIQAQTHSAYRADQPEIVRTLTAAGIDPKSPQGQQIIRDQIRGEGPIDRIVADAIRPAPAAAPIAPQQPQGSVQPQSYNGGVQPPPGVVLAADNGQPQPAQTQPPTGTSAGSLFAGKTPEQKRAIAEAMLLNPKYKAMGEQLIKDVEQGNLEKSARGEVEKSMVGNINHVARLNEIEAKFDPKFLQAGFRLGQSFNAVGEYLGKDLDLKSKADLEAYTAFRADTARNFNQLLKENSGTAVTENEYKRMQLQEPNAGAGGMFELPDSPTQFAAKLKASTNALRLAIARQNYMRKSADPASIVADVRSGAVESKLPLDGMKRIIDDRLIQEKARVEQANPNIDPRALRQHLLSVQKQEFGI